MPITPGRTAAQRAYNQKFAVRAKKDPTQPKQEWVLGAIVHMGFFKNLTVTAVNPNGTFGLRSEKGVHYLFKPNNGLTKVEPAPPAAPDAAPSTPTEETPA